MLLLSKSICWRLSVILVFFVLALQGCFETKRVAVVEATVPDGLNSDVPLHPELEPIHFLKPPEVDPNQERAQGVSAGTRHGPFTVTPKNYKKGEWYGSDRDFWVYTQANYKQGDKPTVMLVLDGHRVPDSLSLEPILDNLIAQKKLPPLIAIYLHTGVSKGQRDSQNRRWEMMRRNAEWADYVFGEIMPEVKKRFTYDESGGWCAWGGSSSSVGAFSLAWYRPDKFSRVIGGSPSFVSLRVDRADDWVDADKFKDLVMESDRSDLRVYLSTGYKDLTDEDGPGDKVLTWAEVNIELARALNARGHAWRFFFRADHDHGPTYLRRNITEALLWTWAGHPLR